MMHRLLMSALLESQIGSVLSGAGEGYPRQPYTDSDGFTFVDNMQSIDCNLGDTTAWCKLRTDATIVTKQVIDLPRLGAVRFNVLIEETGNTSRPMCVGFLPAGTSKQIGSNCFIGERGFDDATGLLSLQDECALMARGNPLDSDVGGAFKRNEVISICILDGKTVTLERNGVRVSSRSFTVQGCIRFGVSLCGEGMKVSIVRQARPNPQDQTGRSSSSDPLSAFAQMLGQLTLESRGGGSPSGFDIAKGFHFAPNLKSISVTGDTAKCIREIHSSLLTEQTFNSNGSTEFSVRIDQISPETPFGIGLVQADPVDGHGNNHFGASEFRGSVGFISVYSKASVMMGGRREPVDCPAWKSRDRLKVRVERGQYEFFHNGNLVYRSPPAQLAARQRYGVSLTAIGHQVTILNAFPSPLLMGTQVVILSDTNAIVQALRGSGLEPQQRFPFAGKQGVVERFDCSDRTLRVQFPDGQGEWFTYDCLNVTSRMDYKCPNGHQLTPFKTPHDSFICDGGNHEVADGAVLYGCRICNHDLCSTCLPITSTTPPPAPPATPSPTSIPSRGMPTPQTQAPSVPTSVSPSSPQVRKNEWKCLSCGTMSPPNAHVCARCKAERPPYTYMEMPWQYPKSLDEITGWFSPDGCLHGRLTLRKGSPEWNRALKFFTATSNGKFHVTRIDLIRNANMEGIFEGNCNNLERRSKQPAFQPSWRTENEVPHRIANFGVLERLALAHRPNQWPYSGFWVLPLWHGCQEAVVGCIADHGYEALHTTDHGFFGSEGSYFTSHSEYACHVYSAKGNPTRGGVVLMNWVSLQNTYPVVPSDVSRVRDQPKYKNYDSYYVPVVPRGPLPNEVNFDACPSGAQPKFDEFVVFNYNQVLPRYVFFFEPASQS